MNTFLRHIQANLNAMFRVAVIFLYRKKIEKLYVFFSPHPFSRIFPRLLIYFLRFRSALKENEEAKYCSYSVLCAPDRYFSLSSAARNPEKGENIGRLGHFQILKFYFRIYRDHVIFQFDPW